MRMCFGFRAQAFNDDFLGTAFQRGGCRVCQGCSLKVDGSLSQFSPDNLFFSLGMQQARAKTKHQKEEKMFFHIVLFFE